MYNPQLETFLRVADAGSFNKAAEESYITPTAIIKQINLLEDSLGVKLFERTRRGLTLTKAGRSMYQDAKYIIQYCHDSVIRARNAMQEDSNVIRIGSSPMTPAQLLMELWSKVQTICPDIKFQIDSANAVNRADEKVQQAYKNSRDGIVVLPCYLPWKNGLYKTDALFVIYPSQRGGWSAQCVTDHKTKKPKLPFPQSWAGQPQEVIEQKSGIEGISFCHASRFLITAKDKETALAACRQVLKNNGRI